MERTIPYIQSVINAAELVAKPTARASTPVTITQEQLAALIEAAKRYVERYD